MHTGKGGNVLGGSQKSLVRAAKAAGALHVELGHGQGLARRLHLGTTLLHDAHEEGILIEAGLLGLLIFWGVIVGWNWSAWRLVRSSRAPPWTKQMAVLLRGVMGIAFWQMVGHEITFTPIDQSIIYFVAGCVVGMRATFEPPAKRIAVSVVPGMTPSQA